MSQANHAAFDPAEQEILSSLVPEGADANEPIGLPTAEIAPAASTPDAPAATAPVIPAAEAAPATGTAEATGTPATPPPPQGDTRAALRAARHAEKRLRDENQRLTEELEALRAGKTPVDTEISDEELAQLEEDFPLQAKIVHQQRALVSRLAEQAKANEPPPEFEAPSYAPHIQEVIDSVPQLVEWQFDPNAQDKFARAVEYDKALSLDPDWKSRNAADRFAEAARRTQAAFGASPVTSSSLAANAATPRIDPAAALAAAQPSGPKGISDFRGGAPAANTGINFSGMSDEAIMASLPAG